jgi:hypothetical protein
LKRLLALTRCLSRYVEKDLDGFQDAADATARAMPITAVERGDPIGFQPYLPPTYGRRGMRASVKGLAVRESMVSWVRIEPRRSLFELTAEAMPKRKIRCRQPPPKPLHTH